MRNKLIVKSPRKKVFVEITPHSQQLQKEKKQLFYYLPLLTAAPSDNVESYFYYTRFSNSHSLWSNYSEPMTPPNIAEEIESNQVATFPQINLQYSEDRKSLYNKSIDQLLTGQGYDSINLNNPISTVVNLFVELPFIVELVTKATNIGRRSSNIQGAITKAVSMKDTN